MKKKEKGYWVAKKEKFTSGTEARSRASALRSHEPIAHVKVAKQSDYYVVKYSIAKWYLEQLEKAGVKL